MYIETRTTHRQVLDDVGLHLNYKLNNLIASAIERKRHPSYMSKRMLKDKVLEVRGAASLARNVYGGELPQALGEKLQEAFAQAATALEDG